MLPESVQISHDQEFDEGYPSYRQRKFYSIDRSSGEATALLL